MALTKLKTSGIADDAVTTDKLANAINTERTANTAKVSTTINNNADNRVITGSGTANTLNGEAGLTYDSGGMAITGDSDRDGLKITQSGNNYGEFMFNSNRSSSGNALGVIRGEWNSTEVASIYLSAGSDTTNKDDGQIRFFTSPDSGTGIQTRMLIDSSGHVGIGDTSPAELLTLRDATPRIRLEDSDTTNAACQFVGDNANVLIQADTAGVVNDSNISFAVDGGECLRINSTGDLLLGTTTVPTSYLTGNTLAVIDDNNAGASCIEVGGSTNLNGYNAGSIHFINNANSNSTTPWNANAKIVSIIRTQIVTSDNNAGDDSGADLVFYRKPEGGSGTEGVRFKSNGDVSLVDGNLVVASGHGIDFSATSDVSGAGSELLDDYEEGTWTPTCTASGGGSWPSAHVKGYYTKVGRLVTVWFCYENFSDQYNTVKGSGGGSAVLTWGGLPFTVDTYMYTPHFATWGFNYPGTISTATGSLYCFINDDSTSMEPYFVSDNAGGSQVTVGALGQAYIRGQFSYIAA